MKKIVVDHIYDLYDLYLVTHNRTTGYRMTEVQNIANLLDQHRTIFPKAKSTISNYHIYELLAGHGEFEKAWKYLHAAGDNVPEPHSYWSIESVAPPDLNDVNSTRNIVVGDVCSYVPDSVHNLIINPYYGFDSVLDLTGPERIGTTRATQAMVTTSGQILSKTGGWFYCHFTPQSEMGFENMGPMALDLNIPSNSKLRPLFGIGPDDKAYVTLSYTVQYNRIAGSVEEVYEPFKIYKNGKQVGLVTTTQKWSYRYYLEQDIVNMLRDAGFDVSQTLFAHFNPAVGNCTNVLPPLVNEAGEGSDAEYPNCFLAYMPPAKVEKPKQSKSTTK